MTVHSTTTSIPCAVCSATICGSNFNQQQVHVYQPVQQTPIYQPAQVTPTYQQAPAAPSYQQPKAQAPRQNASA